VHAKQSCCTFPLEFPFPELNINLQHLEKKYEVLYCDLLFIFIHKNKSIYIIVLQQIQITSELISMCDNLKITGSSADKFIFVCYFFLIRIKN